MRSIRSAVGWSPIRYRHRMVALPRRASCRRCSATTSLSQRPRLTSSGWSTFAMTHSSSSSRITEITAGDSLSGIGSGEVRGGEAAGGVGDVDVQVGARVVEGHEMYEGRDVACGGAAFGLPDPGAGGHDGVEGADEAERVGVGSVRGDAAEAVEVDGLAAAVDPVRGLGAGAVELAGAVPVDVGDPDSPEGGQGDGDDLQDAVVDAAVRDGAAFGDPADLTEVVGDEAGDAAGVDRGDEVLRERAAVGGHVRGAGGLPNR